MEVEVWSFGVAVGRFCGHALVWEATPSPGDAPAALPPAELLLPPVVWGLVPSLFFLCGVGSGGVDSVLLVGSNQTIFCGRRVCSESLGCPFKCFGRPCKIPVRNYIQCCGIGSVLMTSRPPIIY